MTEEQVTKTIINYLELNGWTIICYDFPQSGTGYALHINTEFRVGKNKGIIIPDIVAIKSLNVVVFENKDRFVLSDFSKIYDLKSKGFYSTSLAQLLKGFDYSKIFFGVGIPFSNDNLVKTINKTENIDFAIFVDYNDSIRLEYQSESIFD